MLVKHYSDRDLKLPHLFPSAPLILPAPPSLPPSLANPQIDMFRKRFGYVEDAVSESTLKRASGDAAAWAALTGRVGGKAPAAGDAYVLKAPITYAK